jgi:glutamine cyclotransferase
MKNTGTLKVTTPTDFEPDIDLKNGRIGDPIPLNGELEFLATDEAGKVYINLMTTNEVAVVDLKARRVLANWPVAPGGQPVGWPLIAVTGASSPIVAALRS